MKHLFSYLRLFKALYRATIAIKESYLHRSCHSAHTYEVRFKLRFYLTFGYDL